MQLVTLYNLTLSIFLCNMRKTGCSLVHNVVFFMLISTSIASATAELTESFHRKLLISNQGGAINSTEEEYAVIFDAGSTGTRVHVFRFNSSDLELLPIGQEFEFNNRTAPGLSAYANTPRAAADSLRPLLQQAQVLVPTQLHPQTPVRLGATAGLRLLSGDTAGRILEEVRDLFANESSLRYRSEWVSVINGFQEGSYMWVAMNYLLGNFGRPYQETVAVVDLGGASVQMAYAISEESAANASRSVALGDYLAEWSLNGTRYTIYTHSYLNYGLEAARAQILSLTANRGNPCALNGYRGTYNFSGVVYNVSTPPMGNNIHRCRSLTRRTLNMDASCPHQNCTFNSIWNGGLGEGQDELYVATSFFFTAFAANIIDPNTMSAQVRPIDYRRAANVACNMRIEDVRTVFPNVLEDNVPFLCMDLLYEYTLLVDGFGVKTKRNITVVHNLDYQGAEFEAAWPLGAALDLLSPPHLKLSLYHL